MASKKIQGITIEIGGNTTKLQDALKGVDRQVYALNGELKNLDKALKLDPKNTELLAQKQDVLKRNIEATTEKLNTLKEAQRQMGDYNKLTDAQKSSYNALSLEIAKTESALKGMNNELRQQGKIDLSQLQSALKKVGEVALDVTKKLLKVTAAVGTALAGVIATSVKSYAKLEQAQKGAERLFGNSFKIVQANAKEAYKNLGLSASEYYDQVNTYAVGLKNALNGDEEAAAKLSNSILEAQADIVAATGADTQAVQNAFAAVMRGNYTMIDNLRLGIKGSKEGMQEVIDKVNEWRRANGDSTRLVMGNYADMQQALVDYVKMQGLTGTASKQMSSTINGSIKQMKAAFDNFLNGSGSPAALTETVINVLKNVGTAIKELAPDILNGIVELVEELLPQVITMLFDLLPQLLDAVSNLLDTLLESLRNNNDGIAETISALIDAVVRFISENLPKVVEAAILIIEALAKGLIKSIPTIIDAIIDVIFSLIDTILDNLPEFIMVGLDLIIALAEGLIEAIPKLLEKIPTIITKLVTALTSPEMIQKLITTGINLIVKLAEGLIQGIPRLIMAIPTIIKAIFEGFKTFITTTNWGQLGSSILDGILSGLRNIGNKIKSTVQYVGEKIGTGIKKVFGIASPSKVMRDEVGVFIGEGITEGILEGVDETQRQVNDAMRGLANGMETSLNPTINPSISYETNYTMMAAAMKEALQDMEVELDDREVGKFVIKTVENEVYS